MTPADIADDFLTKRGLGSSESLRLRRYRQDWFLFDGRIFRKLSDEEVRADVAGFLRRPETRASVTRHMVGNVLTNLEAICILPNKVEWPARYSAEGWVTQQQCIVMQNGILNLAALRGATNEPVLSPHAPAFLSRVCLPYDYDPHATCRAWLDFLQVVLPEPDCQQLVQELFGYCLTYDISMQKFFLFVGPGGNGKGVTLNILGRLVGAENVSAVPLGRFGGAHDLVETLGKLVNITNEVGDRLDEDTLKQYVSGDLMYFNPKHKATFTAKPTAKLVNATNELPDVKDCSEGFWRRLVLLPFDVTIPENKMDAQLEHKLAQELSGILNWSIAGAQALYQRGRFVEPNESVVARHQWRGSMNSIEQFFDKNYEASEDGEMGKGDLYRDYGDWCNQNGYRAQSRSEFHRQIYLRFPTIKEQRCRTDALHRPRTYRGIARRSLLCSQE